MLKIGIIGGAEIAHRMFIPALLDTEGICCSVIASHQEERRRKFQEDFGIKAISSYEEVIESPDIEAVYIPLPPALHYQWAKKALECGKHVFLEKPSTTGYAETEELAALARSRELVIQENYMFQYHSQYVTIKKMLSEGILGDVRLFRTSFGFPLRGADDFRYNKELGGGALLDAGGYVTKLASLLLDDTIAVKTACLNHIPGYNVDMFGSVSFEDQRGRVVQGSFSLDCYYQCALEIWGNKGKLFTNRIFTAPPGYQPSVILETQQGKEEIKLESDNHFKRSIEQFIKAVEDEKIRNEMAVQLVKQSKLIESIRRRCND